MFELLRIFRQGSRYDAALEKVYGFNTEGLDTLWRDYVTAPVPPAGEKVTHPAPIGVLAALATGPLLALGLTAKSWRRD